MNILEVEDMIKGMPDESLFREAQQPTGQVPQFLVISEIQRRSDMRRRYQAQQERPQATVKDQIMQEGIGGMAPQQMRQDLGGAPQQLPQPPAMPQQQMGMPAQPGGMGAPAGAPMQAPVQMKEGGIVKMQDMGRVPGMSQTELIQRAQGLGLPLQQIQAALQAGRLRELIDSSSSMGLPSLGTPGIELSMSTAEAVPLDIDRAYDKRNELERLAAQVRSLDPVSVAAPAAVPTVSRAGSVMPDDRERPLDDSYFGGQPGDLSDQQGLGSMGLPSTGSMVAGATNFDADPAMEQFQKLLDDQKQRQTVDYSQFKKQIDKQTAERDKLAEERVAELISEAEKETGALSQEARRDATAQALIQFGAGIAGGDISRGLEKAGTTAYAITAKARDDARQRMREAREEGRSTIDAARSAADSAFNTMLQLDMKTEEGKVAAANALQDSKNSILTAMADRAGENADSKRQIYANLARTTAAIEQAAIDRLSEMAKNQGLNQRAILTLVGDLVEGIPELSGASSDEIGQIVATIGSKIALQMGMDIGSLPETGDQGTGDNQFAGFSATRVK